MKNLTPTLLALAAVAPCAMALDITQSDSDVKLGLSLQLQVRAQVATASAESAGKVEPYDVISGVTGQKADDADFYLRRARFGFKGSYQDNTKFALIVTSDKAYVNNNGVTLYNAWVGREIKSGNLTHYVQAGLNSAFFNGTANIYSSTTSLLPTVRSTERAEVVAPRVVGVQYKLTAPNVTWGFDIGNNTGDSANSTTGANSPKGEGLVYTTRVQISPEGDLKIDTPKETFMGKAGKGVLLGIDLGQNQRDNTGAASVTTNAIGADLLVHVDGLTALAEARYAKANTTMAAGTDTVVGTNIYILQAGYAMPCMLAPSNVIEPAIRLQRINLDNSSKEISSYGTNLDYGNSGYEYDLGANYYFNGKANNKVSVQYTYWKAESGEGRAHIGMAQYQLYF